MRKRALIIAPSFGVASRELWSVGGRAHALARGLAEAGHVINVLCPSDRIEAESSLRLIVDDLGWHMPSVEGRMRPRPAYALSMRQGFHAARELVMRLQPHLVIALGAFPAAGLAYQIHDLYGVPYVLLEFGQLRGYSGLTYRSFVSQVHADAEFSGAASHPCREKIASKTGANVEWSPAGLRPQSRPAGRRFLVLGEQKHTAKSLRELAQEVSGVSVTWVNTESPGDVGCLSREARAAGQRDLQSLADRHDVLVLNGSLAVHESRGLASDLGLHTIGPQNGALEGVFEAPYRSGSHVSLLGRMRQAALGTAESSHVPQEGIEKSAQMIDGLLTRLRS